MAKLSFHFVLVQAAFPLYDLSLAILGYIDANTTDTKYSLEGWTWQQQRSSGQSNVARFFVYFATLDLPWGNLK